MQFDTSECRENKEKSDICETFFFFFPQNLSVNKYSLARYVIASVYVVASSMFQMNVVNLHSSCTMILLGILASTTIIGLTSSAPLSSYERREDVSDDRPKIFLLMDQRIPELEVCFFFFLLGRTPYTTRDIYFRYYCGVKIALFSL